MQDELKIGLPGRFDKGSGSHGNAVACTGCELCVQVCGSEAMKGGLNDA